MKMTLSKFLISHQIMDWRYNIDVDHKDTWVPVGIVTSWIKRLVIGQIAEEIK
jgi:hypothetical protein